MITFVDNNDNSSSKKTFILQVKNTPYHYPKSVLETLDIYSNNSFFISTH